MHKILDIFCCRHRRLKLVFPLQRGKSRENFFNEFMVGSNPNEISLKKVGNGKRLNFGDWIQKTVKKDSQKIYEPYFSLNKEDLRPRTTTVHV